jgi:DNA-binding CsgD family transcriptional regulator
MELLERGTELGRLRKALDRCADGRGGVVALTGPVGSGRTQLLYAFASEVSRARAVQLDAVGSSMERELPLALLVQLFQNAPITPEVGAKVCQLLTEGIRSADADSSGRLTVAVLHGLAGALLALAKDQPLVISVDDVQYADPQSLECLLYLVRRTRQSRVLVVLGEREFAMVAHPLFDTELVRQPHYDRVRLGLLSPDGASGLVAARLGQATAQRVTPAFHAATGGNPLLLRALVQEYQAAGNTGAGWPLEQLLLGETFQRDLLSCLYRLDPAVLEVARALALVGRPLPPDGLAELVGLPEASATRAVEALTGSGLLAQGDFRHPSIREHVIGTMTTEQQHALRARTARITDRAGTTGVRYPGSDLRQRSSVLREAVAELQDSGRDDESADKSAPDLADLSFAYQALGESGRGLMTARRALRIAQGLGGQRAPQVAAVPFEVRPLPRQTAGPGTAGPGTAAGDDHPTELSEAERRVAELAAQGLMNREIAARLFITVSTVEQHLTRVYRKLGVTRRLDLTPRLDANLAG